MTGSLFIEIECIEAYMLLNKNVAFQRMEQLL